ARSVADASWARRVTTEIRVALMALLAGDQVRRKKNGRSVSGRGRRVRCGSAATGCANSPDARKRRPWRWSASWRAWGSMSRAREREPASQATASHQRCAKTTNEKTKIPSDVPGRSLFSSCLTWLQYAGKSPRPTVVFGQRTYARSRCQAGANNAGVVKKWGRGKRSLSLAWGSQASDSERFPLPL